MSEARPRLSEDWLAVWGGLLIFTLSLGVLAGVDLLGWGVKTQVWLQLANALAPVSKTYARFPAFCRCWRLTSFCCWQPPSAPGFATAGRRLRGRVHGHLLDQLRVLDRGELCLYRGDTGHAGELWHPLVLEPDLGSRVHHRFGCGVGCGELFPEVCAIDQDGGSSRMVHQDRYCHPRRIPWRGRCGAIEVWRRP